MKTILLIFTLIIFYSENTIAQEIDEELLDGTFAIELVECGSAIKAFAVIAAAVDKPFNAQELSNTARGYMVSGAYLNWISQNMPDYSKALEWAESLTEIETTSWLALVETHKSNIDDPIPDELEIKLSKCGEYAEVQTLLVEQIRNMMYSTPTQ